MKNNSFLNDNFLLQNKFSEELYHQYASKMPIIDYHNHLSPKLLDEDYQFNNISEAWLQGDHYKWRAMRTLGIAEEYITGGATDKEKFQKWADCVPYTMRNPLYHWTHLELSRYFNVNQLLNKDSANTIYEISSEKLQSRDYSCRNLISSMNVQFLCTTEDPIDDLKHHKSLAQSDFKTKVSTSFRPDRVFTIIKEDYNDYIDQLSAVTDMDISTYTDLKTAVLKRIDYFHENGCRLSDHGLDSISFIASTESELKTIFEKRRLNKIVSVTEAQKFQTAMLIFLAKSYHSKGWVQQYHLGALRNNNDRMHKILGPDTGWDSIGDYSQANSLSQFLNYLDSQNALTKTVIYNLNPADNATFATMIGNFNDGSVKGKVQWGSAWWFLDQKTGMEEQINTLSSMGVLSTFVGMLTDSRSFLSFPRHEYFRRILCNLFGKDIENGELPNDLKFIGSLIEDISYNNIHKFLNL